MFDVGHIDGQLQERLSIHNQMARVGRGIIRRAPGTDGRRKSPGRKGNTVFLSPSPPLPRASLSLPTQSPRSSILSLLRYAAIGLLKSVTLCCTSDEGLAKLRQRSLE